MAHNTLKILAIANSFTVDPLEYFYNIAASAGVDAIVGNVYLGGQSLQNHCDNIQKEKLYMYDKWTKDGKTSTNLTSYDGIVSENWDIIITQQVSACSGKYETFQPYLNHLISYIKAHATNPNVQIGLQMTWADSNESTRSEFSYYQHDQNKMYHAITQAYLRAFEQSDVDILIPSGTAIQNARTNEYLNSVGNQLTRDGFHLDYGMGRFTAGLLWFETLIAGRYKKDIFHDVSYIPNRNDTNRFLVYLAKIAAKNANLNPFNITKI